MSAMAVHLAVRSSLARGCSKPSNAVAGKSAYLAASPPGKAHPVSDMIGALGDSSETYIGGLRGLAVVQHDREVLAEQRFCTLRTLPACLLVWA